MKHGHDCSRQRGLAALEWVLILALVAVIAVIITILIVDSRPVTMPTMR